MLAIFTYGFAISTEAFETAKCPLFTLSNYNTLVELALETGYITQNQMPTLLEWRKNPDGWCR